MIFCYRQKGTLKKTSLNNKPHFVLGFSVSLSPVCFFPTFILLSLLFQAILDVMINLQFTLVETLWKTFWRFSQSQAGDATIAVWVLVFVQAAKDSASISAKTYIFRERERERKLLMHFHTCLLFVSTAMTSQRSVSPNPAWCCCASMSRCYDGAVTVTTAFIRAWWRFSSPMSSDPSPVRLSHSYDTVRLN